MKKIITTKKVELMELKDGASIEIPQGIELEITRNVDDRIVEFSYNGYNFKELVVNEHNGLELVELKGLEAIKQDITDLRGSEVSIFGQRTVLSSEVDEVTIDILDIIDRLESYEVETIEIGKTCEHCQGTGVVTTWYDDEESEVEEECEQCNGEGVIYEDIDASRALEIKYDMGDIEELRHDNSYNWGSPVSNDFDFQVWKDVNDDKIYVDFKVHRYGDVRCNYTDVAVLEFSDEDKFLQVISEANKFIEVDGYDCYISVFSDTIEVNDDEGNYMFSSCACDMSELKDDIVNYIA